MSLTKTLLVVFITTAGILYQGITGLPTGDSKDSILNNGTVASTTKTILSPLANETSSTSINETVSSALNKTGKLPMIVYGTINQQLGNKYQGAEPVNQTSGEPDTPAASIVYGSTTSQNNNTYVTIGQTSHLYLLIPPFDAPLSISVPGLFMPQNASTGGLIFNSNDPMAKRVENLTSAFNTFQQTFDRIIRLASPFLTDNEVSPLVQIHAKDDFIRQTKEIDWLTTVASHRMKLLKLYEQLSVIYNFLKINSKISPEAMSTAKKRKRNVLHSEEKLKQKTQNLVAYVL